MAGVALFDASGSAYQAFANDDIAPHRPDAFRPHWHTGERRGKEHSLPSHGGHIDGLLAHGVMKEHGDRRHYNHEPTREQLWRPCRVTLHQQTHEDRARGAKHCDPPSIRPDPVQGVRMCAPVNLHEYIPLERELGQMGKSVGADGWGAQYRIADELNLEQAFGRKIRVPTLTDRRNGLPVRNPGDKGYATAEHALEYRPRKVFEEFVRTLPLNKLPASFNVSGTDATKDKLGRPIAEHIQIFCITKYRRLSMYCHFNAKAQEILDQTGEAGAGFYLRTLPTPQLPHGTRIKNSDTLQQHNLGAKSTVILCETVKEKPVCASDAEKRRLRMLAEEEGDVKSLNDWKLPGADEAAAAAAAAAAAEAAKAAPPPKKK